VVIDGAGHCKTALAIEAAYRAPKGNSGQIFLSAKKKVMTAVCTQSRRLCADRLFERPQRVGSALGQGDSLVITTSEFLKEKGAKKTKDKVMQ